MPIQAILASSCLAILGATLFVVGPWMFLYLRFPEIPRIVSLLAVLALQTVLLYIKPAAWPLITISLATYVVTVTLWQSSRSRGRFGAHFFLPLRDPFVCFILLYSFLLFLTRWEPPGSDPVKWGSLARLVFEYKSIVGDTWPITSLREMHGATLGIPLSIALTKLMPWLPWERAVGFWLCAALAIFCFALALPLRTWFGQKSAIQGVAFSLVFFTNPQGYLGWGGTPTLVGMTTGLIAIYFARMPPAWSTAPLCGLALAYGSYAHPMGSYLSLWIGIPIALLALRTGFRQKVIPLTLSALVGVVVVAPFLANLRGTGSEQELTLVRNWQVAMSPFLHRENFSLVYNLYIQATSYLWNTAALVAFALLLFATLWRRRDFPFAFPAFLGLGIVLLLIVNAKFWILPFSFLIYPERAATLALLPMGGALSWLCSQTSGKSRGARKWQVVLFAIAILGAAQFKKRIWPYVGASAIGPPEQEAYHWIALNVPHEACVGISGQFSTGAWIPVVSFRCTQPFHGLGMNSLEEERSETRHTPFRYIEGRENAVADRPLVEFGGGLRILRNQ